MLQLSTFLRRYVGLMMVLGSFSLGGNSVAVEAESVAEEFDYVGKKILHINSYHAGYAWSDGIERGIRSRLLVENVWFKTHYMNAKRERSPEAIAEAVEVAITTINTLQPDIVIVSDDVAAKYLLEPHYKNAGLPFVYCGINWDASVYGLPYRNTTGMLEVNLVASLVDLLSEYAKGTKIGFLSIDSLSGHRTLDNYQYSLERKFDQAYFANTVEEWETMFIDLQQQVDYMLLENPDGIEGWLEVKARSFVLQEAQIPIGSVHQWLAPYSLISIIKLPEEQGWWSAEQALKILRGISPSDIPESKNREGKLYANLKMAQKLGVTLSAEILQTAILVDQYN